MHRTPQFLSWNAEKNHLEQEKIHTINHVMIYHHEQSFRARENTYNQSYHELSASMIDDFNNCNNCNRVNDICLRQVTKKGLGCKFLYVLHMGIV